MGATLPSVSGRKLTADERRQRDERIVGASCAGASAVAIAEREHLTDRQVRRILREAEPAAVTVVSLPELQVPKLLELDPFVEVGRCVAAHREAIDQLRTIASGSRADAIRLGAAKAAAATSASLLELLGKVGVVPRSVFEWRGEDDLRAACRVLASMAGEAGIDVEEFCARLGERLRYGERTAIAPTSVVAGLPGTT